MTKNIWAPWRMEYILEPKREGCVFCDALMRGVEGHIDNLILASRKDAFVIMNRFPYSHAHIMVVPKRHVKILSELDGVERNSLFELVAESETAMRKALSPHGMNIGMNIGKTAGAGIEDHLHAHIVPRWEGDTNFMPIIAGLRVVHQHLKDTYLTLLPHFHRLNS